ncbi:MAG: PBP1A family penicillin-binding protein [Moraxellaceae bacterium]|nr:PBP1A family penicillin-binding protein [Moraxellaceae bacterium]
MRIYKEAGRRERIVAVLAFPFCGLLLILAGLYLYLAPQLPDTDQLKEVRFETPLQVLSRDGRLVAEFGEKHTTPLTYEQIPPLFIKAILAAEDDRFFEHEGINYKGLARAFVDIARTGGIQSGGSTITMQVAKNYFLSHERTFSRKFTELLLAKDIEDSLTKQEIMTLYVNKIFLGHRAYGIGAAAQVYYNKKINELSLAEIAMIAGLPKAPSKYNPVNNPKRAMIRRDWILGRMLELGYIRQDEYANAIKAPVGLNFRATFAEVNAPWLAEMVREELVNRFGEGIYSSGYKVYTTVSASRQNAASQAVINGLLAYDRRHGWRGAEASGANELAIRYPIGGLQAARITAVEGTTASAVLKNGTELQLDWDAMRWARPYVSVNQIGPSPKKAADILNVDDIVRVRPRASGGWELTQVPSVQGQLIALHQDTGAIEAVVGGFDFTESKFNRSLQGWRQAGSTLKPFIYSLALERGYTPATLINDSPISFGEGDNAWRPSNSDGEFYGPIRLRRGLYLSRNMVSIRLLQAVGVDNARSYMSRFGFPRDRMQRNLTLALGSAEVLPVQMAAAYAAFANGGFHVTPYFIARVEDNKGKVLFQANPERVCRECENPVQATEPAPEPVPAEITGEGTSITVTEPPAPAMPFVPSYPVASRIMSARAAWQTQSILRDVVVRGTGRSALSLGRGDLAGKTGTTNDAKDAWFAGFGGKVVAVTWVGFDQPKTLGRMEYGGYAALPLWNGFMGPALAGTAEFHPGLPSGLVPVRISMSTGLRTSDDDPDGYIDWLQVEKLPAAPPAGSPAADPAAEPQAAPEEVF